jgi:hypothetical protein
MGPVPALSQVFKQLLLAPGPSVQRPAALQARVPPHGSILQLLLLTAGEFPELWASLRVPALDGLLALLPLHGQAWPKQNAKVLVRFVVSTPGVSALPGASAGAPACKPGRDGQPRRAQHHAQPGT